MPTTLTIEVHFDFICPWCLIGKRQLAQALDEFRRLRPETRVAVTWRSHLLLPDTPFSGLPYQPFYVNRLGSPEAVAARRAQVREAGYRAGVEFNFEQIEVLPNTLAAHEMVGYAERHLGTERTEALIEDLFCAYFQRGQDIGNLSTLRRIGGGLGFSATDLASSLSFSEEKHQQSVDLSTASRQVPGVPYYTIQNRLALSGAQPPEVLLRAMEQALQTA